MIRIDDRNIDDLFTDFTIYSTHYSIGIEWYLDTNVDSSNEGRCFVYYKRRGDREYKEGYPLFRVNYQGYYNGTYGDKLYNMFAGSLMFLEPDTKYDIMLIVFDVNGEQQNIKQTSYSTKAIPELPVNGNIYYVCPDDESTGTGTAIDPYRISQITGDNLVGEANDIFIFQSGTYSGSYNFKNSGTTDGGYIVYKAEEGVTATFESVNIFGAHLWFDNLNFVYNSGVSNKAFGADSETTGIDDIVVVNCNFSEYTYNIVMEDGCCERWYIADNIIEGNKTLGSEDFVGDGVRMNHTSHHTIIHNTISYIADGIRYPGKNVDICYNDIFNTSDDGIEGDYGYANVRVYKNRVTNALNSFFSFQPQYCPPWYVVYNQALVWKSEMFKLRYLDQFLIAHNTLLTWDVIQGHTDLLNFGHFCNNILVSLGGTKATTSRYFQSIGRDQIELQNPLYYRTTIFDLDYRSKNGEMHCNNAWDEDLQIRYDGTNYATPALFYAAEGLEENSIEYAKENVFEEVTDGNLTNVPTLEAEAPREYYTIKSTSPTINTARVLKGINDGYNGSAPDMGCYEKGKALPAYGARR